MANKKTDIREMFNKLLGYAEKSAQQLMADINNPKSYLYDGNIFKMTDSQRRRLGINQKVENVVLKLDTPLSKVWGGYADTTTGVIALTNTGDRLFILCHELGHVLGPQITSFLPGRNKVTMLLDGDALVNEYLATAFAAELSFVAGILKEAIADRNNAGKRKLKKLVIKQDPEGVIEECLRDLQQLYHPNYAEESNLERYVYQYQLNRMK